MRKYAPRRGTTVHPDFIGPRIPSKILSAIRQKYKDRRVKQTLRPGHHLFIGPVMPKNVAEKVNALRWRSEHPEQYRSYNKSWRQQNAEHLREKRAEWKDRNATRLREWRRARHHERNATDTEYGVLRIFRGRITAALKKQRGQKAKRSMDLLGCTIGAARTHIESQFQPGMSWENHGRHGWQIDHIIPCAAFDLTDQDQQAMCFHYTNLQPLWAKDNMAKGDKITPEAIALIVTSQETVETDVLPVYIERAG